MNDSTAKPAFIPERWKDRRGAFYDFRAAWWYRNPTGEPQGVVTRFDSDHGKQIIPFFKPDGRGGFKAGGPAAPVLFGAERLNGHEAPAFVVEGEKCAAALHSLGLVAVSAQGGANQVAGGDWAALAGVPRVYLLPDNDRPGEGYARAACKALARLTPAPELRVVRLPDLPEKGDAADWLAARVPGWNGFDPLPQERRADLARELLALAEQGEPPPADWLTYRAAALQQRLTGRLPEQVAFLLVGAQLAMRHFKQAGLTLPDLDAVNTLMTLARRHSLHVLESQPADRFRLALAELLASGAAHLEPLANDGNREQSPEPLRGPCLGWRNDAKGELYLLSTPTLDAVNTTLSRGDTGLNIRQRALWRQCQQRGWLQAGNPTGTGQETTRTVKIAGKAERVLVFAASALES